MTRWRKLSAPSPVTFWSFLICIAYVPGVLPGAELGRWGLVLLGPALFGIRRLESMLLVLLGWGLVGLFWSQAGLLGLGRWVELTAVLLLIMAQLPLDEVFLGVALGLIISDGFAVMQLAGWKPVMEVASPSGLFENRDVLAELSAFVLLWGVSRRRWWAVGVALLPLVVCQSRVAIALVGVGLFVQIPKWWKGAAFGAVAFGWLMLWALPGKMESAVARVEGWKLGWRLLSPLGLGMGFFQYVSPDNQLVHSDLLQLADEMGLLGGLLVVGWAVWRDWDVGRSDRGLLAATAVAAMVAFPLHLPANALLVSVVLGACRSRVYWMLGPRRNRDEVGVAGADSRGIRQAC